MRLTVVIPTRNRPALAATALRSVLAAGRSDVTVLVSDNSTSEPDRERLAGLCATHESPGLGYVTPPSPLPMSEHWEWARLQAMSAFEPTHVTYLTDRMIFLAGALDTLMSVAGRHPEQVLSYSHDMADDYRRPVRLVQQSWTGRFVEIASPALLELSARAEWAIPLPRMLNCAVPVVVFGEIERRFGSVFGSVSPDFCFCFRCLSVCDSILHLDRSLLLHYAIDLSNGASYARGLLTPDSRDFWTLAGPERHGETPEPRFETLTNAVMQEYCFVSREVGNGTFPAVHRRGYLAANSRDVRRIEEPALRGRMHSLLATTGWGWRLRLSHALAFTGSVVRYVARHPRLLFPMLKRQLWERAPGTLGGAALARLGLDSKAPGEPQFETAAEAIAFAEAHPRPPAAAAWHLHLLEEIPGAVHEVTGART